MDKCELINKLLMELADDAPMSKVMLMAQAVSFELHNKKFSNWVRQEQRGYATDQDIPQYREVQCILKVDIFVPFQGVMTNFTIPIDIISEPSVRKFVSSAKLSQSLSELELINQQNSGEELRLGVPGNVFPYIDKVLNKGNVQRAYRATSATAPLAILNSVKAKLLDFFSYLNQDLDLNENFQNQVIQEKIDKLFDQYIWQ